MVLLTVTTAVKAALQAYAEAKITDNEQETTSIASLQPGDPIEHGTLIKVCKRLRSLGEKPAIKGDNPAWHLDALLRGSSVYRPPPPPKPEPSAEYKALMQRLRHEEEQRQYDRMTAVPAPRNDFINTSFTSHRDFVPSLSHGHSGQEPADEATLKEIQNQLTLIINVLITVLASGVTIWYAARYWAVPQRLALSMTGSLAIAIAEAVVYMGYMRRLEEAKTLERKKIEKKELAETWQTSTSAAETKDTGPVRHRKGKHR